MKYRPWLVLLLLPLAMVVVAEASIANDIGFGSSVGDYVSEDGEMLMESEVSRWTLMAGRFISYDALKANSIPCGQRGRSYYDCNRRATANPYRRGCSVITNCHRYTD